ncbi:MAG: hypothetical protein FJX59_21250 [Alphaproteobacteria bacterium]|nr:hypothetical protein [Alphaproteobacteria bacterium]
MIERAATERTWTLASCVEVIESSYEFMLAYAAQGRDQEGHDTSPTIRMALTALHDALGAIDKVLNPQSQDFIAILRDDARRARAAVGLVLATGNISSQLVDNLNATGHLRTTLTSMFLADEALKQIQAS